MDSQPVKLSVEDQRYLEDCIQEKVDIRLKQMDNTIATLVERLDTRIKQVDIANALLKSKVDDIYELMIRLQGAGSLAKLLFFIIAPAIGVLVWLKDHVKL